MVAIWVDSDACPVKEEVIRVAGRYHLCVTFVSNQGMRPSRLPNVQYKVVGAEFDAADNWIYENSSSGDIVITSDILLADRCLTKDCIAVSPTGRVFNKHNIGAIKATRELHAHLRETGDSAGHNPAFSAKDRSQFLQSLDSVIQRAM